MVAATQSQPQPQAQPKQPPTPTAAAKPSPEEEALKRNTDCVYFLASPLTCKKGSECEYRHSEYARVNPRDCYYWLNGNCLNPKCGFRHPPLDGLLGTQMGAPPASVPSANMAVVPAPPVPYNSGAPPSKQAVPCIFFQKGLCLKGDRCAFSHGLNPTFNKTPQPTVSTSSVEPHMLKKDFGGLVKCSQPPKAAIGVPPEAKTVSTRNGAGTDKNLPISAGFGDDVPRYKVPTGPSVVNGSSIGRPNRLHHIADEQSFPTSKDTDEHLRESSPGFDVLVDDEHGDSDYYHGEDQYGRARAHEGRNINEYDTGRFGNFEAMADADREMYSDSLGYDSFDHVQGKYGWEQHGATSEGARGATHQERRSYSKSEGPDLFEESDLRYRLSKHRRVNGLRSVVSHDHARENHGEERNHWGSLRKDSQNMPPHESPVSSRFRGRIKLHTSSAADTQGEIDRARNWSSPGRPQFSSHQGRLRDRLKGRVDEEYNNKDGRNFRGPRMMDEQHSDFTGPKSLAELKSGKNADNKESQSLGKRKIMEGNPQNEGDLSFKGPLPFSEILKRKRQAEAAASGSGTSSVSENNNEKQSALSSDSKEKTFSKEEPKLTTGYATGIVEGKSDVAHGESAALPNASEHENENTMMEEEGVEDHELEGDGQGDGEYYYEEGEEGDYAYEEGENVEGDYTYEGGENVEGDYIYEEGENVEGEEHLECGE